MKEKIIIALILITGITIGVDQFMSQRNLTDNVSYSSASWPRRYENVEELATSNNVDIIAYGVVIDKEPYKDYTKDLRIYFISTNYSFKVLELLKGSEEAKIIEVHQSGGTLDGKTEIIREDPLISVGETLILFLHEWAPGKYYIEGGPQGRFIVEKGKVYSLAEKYRSTDVQRMVKHLNTNGQNINQFKSKILAALAKSS